MKERVARWVAIAAVFLALAYVADRVALVYRIPGGRQQFGSVEVHKMLAVPQKDRKTEYIATPAETEQCAHSLFPQLGLEPCWYLARHSNQQVNY